MENDKIIPFDRLRSWRRQLRLEGRKLVVTNGVFDIIHCGHVKYLQEAAALGDVLLVCVNDDNGVRELKGDSRPINPQEARAAVLAGLGAVGAVTIFPGRQAILALEAAEPDVYVKGGDYTLETLDQDELKILQRAGADIHFIPFVGNFSTTNTIRKLRGDQDINLSDAGKTEDQEWPAVLNPLFRRRSIRKYQPHPIDHNILTTLVKAGMAAPSACAKNPWKFVVIDNTATLAKLSEALPNGKHLGQATAAILVIGDLKQAHDGQLSYLLQDCAAAIENILLAASMLNLGACWLGVHPRQNRMEAISGFFHLPENLIPVSLISLGWPGEEKPARTNFNSEVLHWNLW